MSHIVPSQNRSNRALKLSGCSFFNISYIAVYALFIKAGSVLFKWVRASSVTEAYPSSLHRLETSIAAFGCCPCFLFGGMLIWPETVSMQWNVLHDRSTWAKMATETSGPGHHVDDIRTHEFIQTASQGGNPNRRYDMFHVMLQLSIQTASQGGLSARCSYHCRNSSCVQS